MSGSQENKEFKKLVQVWERDVLRLPEPSNLGEGNNLNYLENATLFLIGRLDMILRKTAIRALMQGNKNISTELLKEVISTTKWTSGKNKEF